MNVVGPILHFGKAQPNAPALIEGDRTITYGELTEIVRKTASFLSAQGFTRGDRIGLCLKDTAGHIVTLLAVAHAGCVAVPLDWRARPAENARFVDALGLSSVLVEPGIQLPSSVPVHVLDAGWRRSVSQTSVSRDSPGDWNDPFVISATSGSTGLPKFTLMTHSQYYFAIAGMFELMSFVGRHRFLCTMPLYYSGGRNSCMAHLLRGDCVVLYPSLFAPAEYLDVIKRRQITIAGIVPSVVRQLLAVVGTKLLLPELEILFSAGAPLYAEEKRAAVRKLNPNFHERYGTAETLAISVLRPSDLTERAESVGQPHSLVEVEIVDENDQPLLHGSTGRLRVRGPGLATPLPGAAEASFNNGWFYPGEIAHLDEAGYIFLHGRTSDVIMRSGAKIFPAEVEAVLLDHPEVTEAAVLGHRGPDNEEAVIAFVVRRKNLSLGELLAHCRTRLTSHKIPREFHFLDHLPKNTAGKVDKLALAKYLNDGIS